MSNVCSISGFYKDYLHDDVGNPYAMKEILRFVPERDCKILDVGCGTGSKSRRLIKDGNSLLGIDVSIKQIDRALEVLSDVVVQDLADGLAFKDGVFEVVYCSNVLEHLFGFRKVLLEAYRVLKTNGRILVEVPNVNY